MIRRAWRDGTKRAKNNVRNCRGSSGYAKKYVLRRSNSVVRDMSTTRTSVGVLLCCSKRIVWLSSLPVSALVRMQSRPASRGATNTFSNLAEIRLKCFSRGSPSNVEREMIVSYRLIIDDGLIAVEVEIVKVGPEVELDMDEDNGVEEKERQRSNAPRSCSCMMLRSCESCAWISCN